MGVIIVLIILVVILLVLGFSLNVTARKGDVMLRKALDELDSKKKNDSESKVNHPASLEER